MNSEVTSVSDNLVEELMAVETIGGTMKMDIDQALALARRIAADNDCPAVVCKSMLSGRGLAVRMVPWHRIEDVRKWSEGQQADGNRVVWPEWCRWHHASV
jgi:hypothetical protein